MISRKIGIFPFRFDDFSHWTLVILKGISKKFLLRTYELGFYRSHDVIFFSLTKFPSIDVSRIKK